MPPFELHGKKIIQFSFLVWSAFPHQDACEICLYYDKNYLIT